MNNVKGFNVYIDSNENLFYSNELMELLGTEVVMAYQGINKDTYIIFKENNKYNKRQAIIDKKRTTINSKTIDYDMIIVGKSKLELSKNDIEVINKKDIINIDTNNKMLFVATDDLVYELYKLQFQNPELPLNEVMKKNKQLIKTRNL